MYATISQAPRRGRRNRCCNTTLGAHKMARGGDVNAGFSTMDFGDGKWFLPDRPFFKNRFFRTDHFPSPKSIVENPTLTSPPLAILCAPRVALQQLFLLPLLGAC